jgi:hypothetical protein
MLARPLHIQVCLGARARVCVCVKPVITYGFESTMQGGNLMFAADCPKQRDAFMTDMTLGRSSHVPADKCNRLSLEPEQFPQLITYALDLAGFDLGILKASITSTFLYVPFQSTHSISTVNGHSLTDLSAVCQLCGVH